MLVLGKLTMLITRILCYIIFKRFSQSKISSTGSLPGTVREISVTIERQNLILNMPSDIVFGEKDDNAFALQEQGEREFPEISFYFVNTIEGGKRWPLSDVESSVLAFALGKLETLA